MVIFEQDHSTYWRDCAIFLCGHPIWGLSFGSINDGGEIIISVHGQMPPESERLVMQVWGSIGDDGWRVAHSGRLRIQWDSSSAGGRVTTLPTPGTMLELIYLHQRTVGAYKSRSGVDAPPDHIEGRPDERLTVDHRAPFDIARQWLQREWLNCSGAGEPFHSLRCIGGEFFLWTGMSYEPVSDGAIRAQLYQWLSGALRLSDSEPVRPDQSLVSKVADALRAAAHLDGDPVQDFWIDDEGEPGLIAVENGLLDPSTRMLCPHTPRYFNRCALPIWFEPGCHGEPREWLHFLRSVWGEDAESIRLLQQWFGYFVAGGLEQQKILLLVGPPRSGKGSVCGVLTQLLGAANVAGPSLGDLASQFGLAQLLGKRAAIVGDARFAGRPDQMAQVTTRLLSISGGDVLSVDRKYHVPWVGRLPVRLAIATNEVPRLTDQSGALASRFSILRMRNSFLGREDLGLADRLQKELSAILAWSLEGLEALRVNGRFIEPATSTSTAEGLVELGSPMQSFVGDECEVVAGAKTRRKCLFHAWERWCEVQGRSPGTSAMFRRDLQAAFPSIEVEQERAGDFRGERLFAGIRLHSEPAF